MSGFADALEGDAEWKRHRLEAMLAYSYTNGIIMGVGTRGGPTEAQEQAQVQGAVRVTHAPFALLPFHFPESAFLRATLLSRPFNKLMDRVSRDVDWLVDVLGATGKADPFTSKLLGILVESRAVEPMQRISLGVLRSDYMVHSVEGDERNLLQVEINTIASSFGCISTKMTRMMKTVEDARIYTSREIPDNSAMSGIADGIATAHKAWIMQQLVSAHSHRPIIVIMVVQPGETNFCDQRLLHFALKETHDIVCQRATLREIYQHGHVDGSGGTGQLIFRGCVVSVVYFRAGYSPDDYPTEDEWQARLLVEKSLAVKCPNIGLHLAGSKKVQQELARANAVERYLTAKESKQIRTCFAGLYALDEQKDVDELRVKAEANVGGFVLKPQREGGGNNFYSESMLDSLRQKSLQELKAFIMMERIRPPVQDAIFVRNDVVSRALCISELGIFGVFVSDANDQQGEGRKEGEGEDEEEGEEEMLANAYVGYLLRVKPASSDEGGVAAGFAVLGCPCLF